MTKTLDEKLIQYATFLEDMIKQRGENMRRMILFSHREDKPYSYIQFDKELHFQDAYTASRDQLYQLFPEIEKKMKGGQ